ncbi:MAG: aromatic ring-hydroxylating dioxygenase subunit alpha, partial [Myxococcota bacterium]
LFRSGQRNPITAIVRRFSDRAEAEFIGEPRPQGIIGRLLSPGGGQVEHFDRFILPSIAQVEYRLGPRNHVVVTSTLTPISDFETRLYAVATFRTILPDRLLKAAAAPIGMAILEQDRRMLRRQTETIRRFGGEQFVSTEVDLLGPHIWRLMRQAERGDPVDNEVFEQRVSLLA